MFILENDYYSDEDFSVFVTEAVNNSLLKTTIIDPLIKVLETPKGRKEYIDVGNEFLEANSEMLSKEYPTKKVSFPRGYVDRIFNNFGFTKKEFETTLKEVLKDYNSEKNFSSITLTPTNFIHSIVLYYSDMIQHRQLRDSARFQLGLTIYNTIYNVFWPKGIKETTMAYTYSELDKSFNLVKSENVMNWIVSATDSCYVFWKSRMSLNMSTGVIVQFLNRVRTTFRQYIQVLSSRYYNDIDNNNEVNEDVDSDDQYVETSSISIRYRNNLLRKLFSGDNLYDNMGVLYTGTAKLKNVKVEDLFNLAKKVERSDISKIIDTIFYVFIVKEGNTFDDINSYKYINRITNLPTAVDRAIKGKPIIIPFKNKYKTTDLLSKAYICLIAVYIMNRINEVK